jgi:hypothetical protein
MSVETIFSDRRDCQIQIHTARQMWRLIDGVANWEIHWSAGITEGHYWFNITFNDGGKWVAGSGEISYAEKDKYDREWERRAEAHKKTLLAGVAVRAAGDELTKNAPVDARLAGAVDSETDIAAPAPTLSAVREVMGKDAAAVALNGQRLLVPTVETLSAGAVEEPAGSRRLGPQLLRTPADSFSITEAIHA